MANTTLNIAEANPVKFYSETLTYPDNYRSRFMDDFTFQNQIRSYEEPVKYTQKWMHDEVINLQFQTDYDDLKIQVIGCYEQVYKTVIPVAALSDIDLTPLEFRNVSITLDDLPPGEFSLRIKVTVDTGVKYYTSEPMEVQEVIENSVLLHWSNETNDYDVAFDTDIVFQARFEGGLTEFKPGVKSKVYEDQNLNAVRLSAFPFRTYKLVIAGPEGVPDWVADKINRIFCCDYVTIDGQEFVRSEGDMEPRREENYPMSGWAFTVRPATNKHLKEFKTTILYGVLDYDDALLIDYDNSVVEYQ